MIVTSIERERGKRLKEESTAREARGRGERRWKERRGGADVSPPEKS